MITRTPSGPKPELYRHLARCLRQEREKRGWTREDLARRAYALGLDWSHDVVLRLESHHRVISIPEFLMLPQLFPDLALVDLFKEDGPNMSPVLTTAMCRFALRGVPLSAQKCFAAKQ